MTSGYIPDVGHIIWLSLDPQMGREAARRPFLVLSTKAYNDKTSLVVGCPVTSQLKGYPFEVPFPSGGLIGGVVLADQIKSLDWRARFADFAGKCGVATLRRTRGLLSTLLQLS